MSAKRRILLVDDDHEIVRGVGIRLRAAGYDVLTAYDGGAGLQAAQEHLPDAIVLDVRMPVMDGMTVLSKLRESSNTRGIPVIILSASGVGKGKSRALELGARYFLEKPYDPKCLLDAIRSAIAEADARTGVE